MIEHDIIKDLAFFVSASIFICGVAVGVTATLLINVFIAFIKLKDGTDRIS